MPAPPSYQLSKTFSSGSANSTAKASIGYVANSTAATFTLAPGTGVTQSDPGNAAYPGDSMLRINFDGWFKATSPSFGPPATGYVSVAVGGIVGAGGSAKFTGQVNFVQTDGVTALRPQVNFSKTFTSAGSFAQTFTSSAGLSPLTIASGSQFRVKGFFEFRASNHAQPSQILPLDMDFGGAPPTATWYASGDGAWGSATNWAPPAGSFFEDLGLTPYSEPEISVTTNSLATFDPYGPSVPTVPNGPGERARFTSLTSGDRTITLNSLVTIGALDFNAKGNLNFVPGNGTAGFLMDTDGGGNAAIVNRNLTGGRTTKLNTKVVLNNDLDVETDGGYTPGDPNRSPKTNIQFNKSISGNSAVNKHGEGNAFLNATNTYTGGTNINGGKLHANVPGSLGTGNVSVDDAQLNYNARHAASNNAFIDAFNGAQIDLGVTPAADENFFVSGNSAVSGNSPALGSLTVQPIGEESDFAAAIATNHWPDDDEDHHHHSNGGGGATVALAPGAMIAHETFDTGKKGNPANLGNVPLYIFGIAANFNRPSDARGITIGSNSNSPWIGFGSDRTERIFGSSPMYSADQIKVKGSADLVSLHETLWLNARLTSVGTNSQINKIGKGSVALESSRNDFRGEVNVYEGSLLVDSALPAVQRVNVWYGANLGGKGKIGGPVFVNDGASISPGGIRANDRAGRLSVDTLTLADTSNLNFDLDKPGVVDCGINDLISVSGDLVLDGVLNVTDLGNFDTGVYTLFKFGGDLTDDGLNLGTLPTSQFSYFITTTSHSVLLNVSSVSPALPVAAVLVPEPGTMSLLLGSFGATMLARRRRSRC
jgi:autotransporter-associated beta strand protein